MTDVNVFGQIRGAVRQFLTGGGQAQQPVLSEGLEQLVNQVLPERAEIVKLGKSYGAAIPTGSAFTFVNAWPTTRAELVLLNGETSGGPSYVIERAWLSAITAGATGPVALLGQIIPSSAPTQGATGPATADNTAVLRHQLSGKTNNTISSNAKLVMANVQFAVANQWFLLGQTPGLVAAAGGSVLAQGVEADVKGRIIIPPQAALCLAGIASIGAGTGIIGLEWHELYLNLG